MVRVAVIALEDEHMVRRVRYGAQYIPYREPVCGQNPLEAGARHSGPCIEHRGARRHQHASDFGGHRAGVSFGEMMAHDTSGMHEPDTSCV
jgi:hypothetical protein